MSMTGGISFFEKNAALFEDGASCVASSNTGDQNLILGTNKYFQWSSIGSNDSTTETLTITLDETKTFNRLFLIDHNFKAFGIQYEDAGAQDFINVLGLDSYSDNQILVTGFARDTAYFEFDAVTTDTIYITIDTTQVVNAQKSLVQFAVTNELGTLTGYPQFPGISLDRNVAKQQAMSGRWHLQKGFESAGFDLNLRTYPNQDDINILDGLHNQELPFMAWLSGGLSDQFTREQRGFRLKDLYQMSIDKPLKNAYYKNLYKSGVNQSYSFIEVVS